MQVELIGCTGAGKTTFVEHLIRECEARKIDAVNSDEFLLGKIGLNWVTNRVARALLIDIICLPGLFRALFLDPAPIGLGLRIVFTTAERMSIFNRLNLARNIIRKFGIYNLLKSTSEGEKVIFVDEGTLHAAHNLFVHEKHPPNLDEVNKFVDLIPLPALALRIEQDKTVLIERTMRRGHSRVRDSTHAGVAGFIGHAERVFDHLMEQLVARQRMLVVEERAHVLRDHAQGNASLLSKLLPLLEMHVIKEVVSNSTPSISSRTE